MLEQHSVDTCIASKFQNAMFEGTIKPMPVMQREIQLVTFVNSCAFPNEQSLNVMVSESEQYFTSDTTIPEGRQSLESLMVIS